MRDRIFPNSVVNKLDSKKIFSGIDWDKVEAQVKKRRNATAQEEDFSDLGLGDESLDGLEEGFMDEGGDFGEADTLIDEIPTDGGDGGTWNLPAEDSAPEEDIDFSSLEEGGDMGLEEEPMSALSQSKGRRTKISRKNRAAKKTVEAQRNKRRVIAFTKESQLSPEAIEYAESIGDIELKEAILSARHQRRLAIASQLEAAREISARKNARMNLIKTAQAELNDDDLIREAQAAIDEAEAEMNAELTPEFKNPSELDYNEKLAFARVAQKYGFPNEYVNFMLNEGNEPSEEASQIVELIQNETVSREAKASAIKAMVRTATLTQGDLSYLRNYWLNILGYDAKDWVDDLFTNKYSKENKMD